MISLDSGQRPMKLVSRRTAASFIQTSGIPYLLIIGVGALLARWAPYIRDDFTFKGQPPYVLISYVFFGISLIAFFLFKPQNRAGKNLRLLIATVALYWIAQFILIGLYHGDNRNYTSFLVPLLLIMMWFKPPSSQDTWSVMVLLGMLLLIILTVTYILEVTSLTNPMPTPGFLNDWESGQYWLPLDGFLGLDGRWVGPFGHNTRTAMAATFVTVIGFSRLTSFSWALIPGGVFFILVSGVRAGFLSTLAALAVLILFSNIGLVRKIPLWTKIALLFVGVAGGALLLLRSGAGLTGRDTIWRAFLDLFPQEPLIGVGQTGINAGGEITLRFVDAHNLLLDPLIRYGIVGLSIFLIILSVMFYQSLRATSLRSAGSLAILTAYVVASMTDIQNDWIHLSYQLVFVLFAAIAAASAIDEHQRRSASTQTLVREGT